MDEPWGMGGGEFACLYLVATVISLGVVVSSRRGLRNEPPSVVSPLDVYTLAAVYGGVRRVVATAVLSLIAAGRLRVSRGNQITPCGEGRAVDPVQQQVLDTVTSGRQLSLGEVGERVRSSPVVRQPVDEAARRGLVVDPAAWCSTRGLVLVPLAVFVFGLGRLVHCLIVQGPVDLLSFLLVCAGVAILLLLVEPPGRTAASRALAERVLARESGLLVPTFPGAAEAQVPLVVVRLAVQGPLGLADRELRTALFPRTPDHRSTNRSGPTGACGDYGPCGGRGGCGGCGGGDR